MGVRSGGSTKAGVVQLPAGEASTYAQFCPVAMAAELLATRWTLIVLGEMLSGSTRFNDIRRGVPRMSPALLTKRLRQLEVAAVVERVGADYVLTAAGRDLAPIVQGVGRWSLRWVDADCSLGNLDPKLLMWNMRRNLRPELLMWNMRRNLRPEPMPHRRVVLEFRYADRPADEQRFWLIVAPGHPVDLCSIEPGHDVDLLVTAELRAMTSAWMGMSAFEDELQAGRIELDGAPMLARSFTQWIGRSGLAGQT